MSAAVARINAQVMELAPALNSPTVGGALTVSSSNPAVPVDAMLKRRDGADYVFAVAMRDGSATGTFEVKGRRGRERVTVLGEGRTLTATDGKFSDSFGGYDVHLYRLPNR
jgi:hypothetical protein